jgi:uroporphyrinogen-III synthase
MNRPLEGRTAALAEGRQLEDLARMLEAEGATALRCPLLSILDAPDPTAVVAWIQDVVAHRLDYVVLMTGEALRRLLGFAERAGLRDQFVAALANTSTVTRGPKPVRALKEIGLAPTKVADVPTTDGVIDALRLEPLLGKTVGVTLYGASNPPLEEFLEGAGAKVRTVLSYVYAAATDAERVADLITRMAAGQVDVLLLTSSPQVDRLVEVAVQRGLESTLRQGCEKTCVAAVGPVLAEHLRERGIRVDVCPEQGFVMKNLVQHIKRALTDG